jgi:predicted esterase
MSASSRRIGPVVLVLGLLAAGCPKPPVEAVPEHWCPEGFEPGQGDVCFAMPMERGPGTAIVVYLHGELEGHGRPEEWAAARSATVHGFAVVLPRGRRGLCDWKPELKNHFCWPQDAADTTEMHNVTAEWDHTLWQVNELLEAGPHPRFVLGYSNGAAFAHHLARTGAFKADGYALISGGAPITEASSAEAHPPILLLGHENDAGQVSKSKELHESLNREKWPNQSCTRPGEHGLAGDDVDAALRFFRHEPVATKGGFVCDGTLPAPPAEPRPPEKAKKKK